MELKLEPRDSMRGARVMCEYYPEATGKEILELVEHDKKCHELYIQQGQEKVRAFAKKINDAGALFYKGRFGLDQRFFYKLSNATVTDKGEIYGTVEHIVCFLGEKGDVCEGRIKIETKKDEFKTFENLGLSMYEKTTEEDYNKVLAHLQSMADFWERFEEDVR